MIKTAYALFGLFVVAGTSLLNWRGFDFTPAAQRQYVAGGLRGASHGGYRSFWYSGFHGGK